MYELVGYSNFVPTPGKHAIRPFRVCRLSSVPDMQIRWNKITPARDKTFWMIMAQCPSLRNKSFFYLKPRSWWAFIQFQPSCLLVQCPSYLQILVLT